MIEDLCSVQVVEGTLAIFDEAREEFIFACDTSRSIILNPREWESDMLYSLGENSKPFDILDYYTPSTLTDGEGFSVYFFAD